MNKQTLLVNFFGGPGTGKSTAMAHCFAELKWKNIDCEMVTEYAKDKVWEGSLDVLQNQIYVTGKQYHRLKRIEGKVDIILTDSPILLGIIYGVREPKSFADLITEYHNSFQNLNIILKRDKPFHQNGRLQDEEGSKAIDQQILDMLLGKNGDLYNIVAKRENINDMVSQIMHTNRKFRELPF